MKRVMAGVTLASLLSVMSFGAERKKLPPRASLGVETVDIRPGLEDVYGHPTWKGALVVHAPEPNQTNSLAPPTLIEVGSLIIEVNKRVIDSTADLLAVLATMTPGQRTRVVSLRNGLRETEDVLLIEERPFIYLPADVCPRESDAGRMIALGLIAGAVTSPTTEAFGRCPFLVPACTMLALSSQNRHRTQVSSLGMTFLIDGDWRSHTHITRESCLDEVRANELKAAPPAN